MPRSLVPLVALWATGLFSLNLLIVSLAQRQVQTQVSDYLSSYLRRSLDASLFGNDQGVVNDRNSILDVGRRLNGVISDIIRDRWYSPLRDCRVAVAAIDDIVLPSVSSGDRQVVIGLERNAIERPVLVHYGCAHSARPHLLWSAFLGFLFLSVYVGLPLPLSRSQRERVNALVAQGYGQAVAQHYATQLDVERLNYRQRACLDALHGPDSGNYETAFRVASTADVAKLTLDQQAWFLCAVAHTNGDIAKSLAIARHADRVEIDLRDGALSIHGMAVSMNKTPLFYLAWYAMKRAAGQGWVANPRSNRPDRSASRELAELMIAHGGHGRAVRDLEEHGLKARTLDQNRSKIKEDIVAVLGPELGAAYLFEIRKDASSRRTCYRFRPEASRIRVHHNPEGSVRGDSSRT